MTYPNHISAINELAATEGVFTTAQAKRFGIPADALSYVCRAGRLECIAKGAYRLAGSQPTQLDELSAAWKLTVPENASRTRDGNQGGGQNLTPRHKHPGLDEGGRAGRRLASLVAKTLLTEAGAEA